ncbi:MAG: GGDEF domain-containing protein [Spirochaetes bacterium]|nr:GGDEF domain-containing protein [Spirochaetota bacterium]
MNYDLTKFFHLSSDLFCITNKDGFFQQINPAFTDTLGYSIENLKKKSFIDLIYPKEKANIVKTIQNLKDNQSSENIKNRFLSASGKLIRLKWKIYFDEKSNLYYSIGQNISDQNEDIETQLEETKKALELLAQTDNLTGIKNRRMIFEQLEVFFSLSDRDDLPLTVIILDIDHFKSFNDQFGNQAGDDILKTIAEILKENSRDCDIVGRYGCEEFCIIVHNTGKQGGLAYAEKLRKTIETHNWKKRPITASFGVYTYTPGKNLDKFISHTEEMIRNAEEALLFSKKSGKNQVHHFSEVCHEMDLET